jgi:YfiR/HmsC-like
MELLKSRQLAALVAALALSASLATATAAPPQPTEYGLKAVFLYQFCRFMEWPRSAFSSPKEPLTIGILGKDPFGPLLNEAIAGESYHDRPIRIEHYRDVSEIRNCQLLFVSRSEAGNTASIVAAVAGKNIVTVGETEQFVDNGGMIALTAEQNHVKLRMNLAMLRKANVEVSSKLLRIADTRF